MDLEFLNKLGDNIKNNEFLNSFRKEVEEKVNKKSKEEQSNKEVVELKAEAIVVENNNVNEVKEELNFIDKLKSECKLSVATVNQLKEERSNLLKVYSNKENNEDLYYVASKRKNGDGYTIFCYHLGEELVDSLEKLPENTGIDSVLRKNDDFFVKDEVLTEEIGKIMLDLSTEIVKKQNDELNDFRKENHVYLVEEDRKGKVYLTDITENNGVVLEEIDFPEELKNIAVEGTKFKYFDGKYEQIEI